MGTSVAPEQQEDELDRALTALRAKAPPDPMDAALTALRSATPKRKLGHPQPPPPLPKPMQAAEPDVTETRKTVGGLGTHLPGQGKSLPGVLAESAMEMVTHPVRLAKDIAMTPVEAGAALRRWDKPGGGGGKAAAIGALQTLALGATGAAEKFVEPLAARVVGEVAAPYVAGAATNAAAGATFTPDRPAVGAIIGGAAGALSSRGAAAEKIAADRARFEELAKQHPDWLGENVPPEEPKLLTSGKPKPAATATVTNASPDLSPDYTVDEPNAPPPVISPLVEKQGIFGGALEQHGRDFAEGKVEPPRTSITPESAAPSPTPPNDLQPVVTPEKAISAPVEDLEANPPARDAKRELRWDKTYIPKVGDFVFGEHKGEQLTGEVVKGGDGILKVKTNKGSTVRLKDRWDQSKWYVEGDEQIAHNKAIDDARKAAKAAKHAEEKRVYDEYMDKLPKVDHTTLQRGDVLHDVSADGGGEPGVFIFDHSTKDGILFAHRPPPERQDAGFLGDGRGLVATGENVHRDAGVLDRIAAEHHKELIDEGEADESDMPGIKPDDETAAGKEQSADERKANMAQRAADAIDETVPAPANKKLGAPKPDAMDQALEKVRAEAKPAADKYDYASTQVNLEGKAAVGIKRLAAAIPDADLAPDGREEAPHVTVKYGLHGTPIEKVRKLLEGEPPVKVTFGKTSFFPNSESNSGDVLKVDVESPDLRRLNKKIADALPHTDTHPGYKPHATIAYLKPGLGEKYAGGDELAGEEVTIDSLSFSGKDGKTVAIPLTGAPGGIAGLKEVAISRGAAADKFSSGDRISYNGDVGVVDAPSRVGDDLRIMLEKDKDGSIVHRVDARKVEPLPDKPFTDRKTGYIKEAAGDSNEATDEETRGKGSAGARPVRDDLAQEPKGSEPGQVREAGEGGHAAIDRAGPGQPGRERVRVEPRRTTETGSGTGGRAGTSATSPGDRVAGEGAGVPGDTGERSGLRARVSEGRIRVAAGENIELHYHDGIGEGGLKQKATENVAAIRLLKELEAANRVPTIAEQMKLARYVGWGGLSAAFDTAHKDFASYGGEELKSLLTDEEYEAARASTPNAHYTSETVIRSLYNTIRNVLGVPSDPSLRILEPSMGVGHFIGFAPHHTRTAHWTGVELDSVTGRIARLLYPKANIHVKGFEQLRQPDNTFDLVIGNVPFGKVKLHEPRYNKLNLSIHNHFIVKSLDLTRPGGVVALITSGYTMDSMNSSARRAFAARGEFIGAIRLPEDAFQKNANTKVVTDILFFRKKGVGVPELAGVEQRAFIRSELTQLEGGEHAINEYFATNPKMVLGKMSIGQGNRGMPMLSVKLEGGELEEKLATAAMRLPQDVYISPARLAKLTGTETPVEPLTEKAQAPDHWTEGQFALQGGKLVQKLEGQVAAVSLAADELVKVKALVQMRDAYREVLRTQRQDEPEVEVIKAREKLNAIYDKFVKQHGPIGKEERTTTKRTLKSGEPLVVIRRPNMRSFSADPTHVLLSALEKYDYETGKAEKRDALLRRVIDPHRVIQKAASPAEALPFVLAEKAQVDLAEIARLSGTTEDEARKGLAGLVYEDPQTGTLELADKYLSGDVKAKLAIAEATTKKAPRFRENVEALKKVQPEDLPPSRIWASLGANWIPQEDVSAFVNDLLDARYSGIELGRSEALALWKITAPNWLKQTTESTKTWGTHRASAVKLIEDALNQRATIVYDPHPDDPKKRVVNATETVAAQEKQEAIKERFAKWLWDDQPRAQRLAKVFNEKYNTIHLSSPDGSHLTFPGAATHVRGKRFELKPHQRNAVWRILQYGNTMLAHVVGAGKTAVMVMAGMEAKRTGLAKKPLYIVPNHLLYQFAGEFQELYPNAEILVATKDDMRGEDRRAFVSRASGHNWDAILMTHRSAESVPMSAEFQRDYINSEVNKLVAEIRAARSGKENRNIVKELETAKKNLESKLQGLLEQKKDEATVNFEDLGVDMMFVDEAHLFKNLNIVSKIRGQGKPGSQRAFDLLMKTMHLDKVNPGRGLVFATGTPIANSISEVHTMMRYLQPRLLRELGLEHFDAWTAAFAEATIAMELNPTGGGYRMWSRFRKFKNVGRLAALFRQVWDVQSADMLKLPHPPLSGGKAAVASTPATAWHEALLKSFDKRAEAIRRKLVDPSVDNFLKITTEGRHAGLDARLVDATQGDRADGKLANVARKVSEIYKAHAKHKGVQLVFSDISAPGSDPSRTLGGVPNWNAYDELKKKLVAEGIPATQVAFIHEGVNDDAKDRLFKAVREGRIRVLIGSTEKMGAGMNVQNRLVAEHHLDAPWRPADIEQREGRILRQGNELFDSGAIDGVSIFRYIQEKSFDAYLWQTLQTKAGFIDQVMRAGPDVDEVEDVSERELTFSEIKAIASGDVRVQEKAVLDAKIAKLQALERQAIDEKFTAGRQLAALPGRVKQLEEKIAAIKADQAAREVTAGEHFKVTLDGKDYVKRPEAGLALQKAVREFHASLAGLSLGERYDKEKSIGKFAGFPLSIKGTGSSVTTYELILTGEIEHDAQVTPDDSPVSLVARLERMLDRTLDAEYTEALEVTLAREKRSEETIRQAASGAFSHSSELTDLKKKQAALDTELKAAAVEREKAADAEPIAGGQLYGVGDPITAAYLTLKQLRRIRAKRTAKRFAKTRTLGAHPTPDPTGLSAHRSAFKPKEIVHSLKALLNPEALGPEAKGAAGTIRHQTAVSFHELTIAHERMRSFIKELDKLPRPLLVDLWDIAEHGGTTGDKVVDAGNAELHKLTEHFTQQLLQLDRLKAERVIENYIGRFWSKPNTQKGIDFLSRIMGRRPFEGPKSFQRHRTLENFLDGLDAGLVPATYNYVEGQLAKIAEMQRVIAAEHILRAEKAAGRAKIVMLGKTTPIDADGHEWLKIDREGNDPAFTVFGPRSGAVTLSQEAKDAGVVPRDVDVFGRRIMGYWFAPRDAAAVWHAHLSSGLRSGSFGPLYRAYMAPANAATQILLGFSGFHLTTIAREGINSGLALSIDSVVNKKGNPLRAGKQLLRAPGAIAVDAAFGRRIMQEFRTPGAHPELAAVLDQMITGGYRGTAESELWTGERMQNLKRAFREAVAAQSKGRRLWGAAKVPLDALWAGIELQMKPLMGMYVPWMKTAATYRAVAQAMAKLPPTAPMSEIEQKMGDIVKEMDYRYGQVVYDNHFVNRVIKDLAQAVFLAPGWTFGTLTLAGRGLGQVASIPYRSWKEKGVPEELIGKSAAYWIGGVLFLMLVNGTLTYLHTGEFPHGKDYWGYRDGTKDSAGNWNRHIIPGYEMRDIYSWSHRPYQTLKNKLKPVLAFMAHAAANKDFFGDNLYDPDASRVTKAKQLGQAALRDLATPLSVQNLLEAERRGERGAGEVARNWLGITPAKREFIRSKAQNKMADYLARAGHAERTPDQVEKGAMRRAVIDAVRAGERAPAAVSEALRSGELKRETVKRWMREAKEPAIVAQFKRLSLEEAEKVYDLGTEREKALWQKAYRTKIVNAR